MSISKVIVVAGGNSSRMNGIDKIFAEVAGKPVIAHTIEVFQNSPFIDSIILVLPERNIKKGQMLVLKNNYTKVVTICKGGETRQQSVKEGLNAAGECDFVIIHDGARPCVTSDSIERGLKEAAINDIAIAVAPMAETIKQVDNNNRVIQTLNRNELKAIHTPQVFRAHILRNVYMLANIEATDDAGLAEHLGYAVKVYEDSQENIKITTKVDLKLAEIILSARLLTNKM